MTAGAAHARGELLPSGAIPGDTDCGSSSPAPALVRRRRRGLQGVEAVGHVAGDGEQQRVRVEKRCTRRHDAPKPGHLGADRDHVEVLVVEEHREVVGGQLGVAVEQAPGCRARWRSRWSKVLVVGHLRARLVVRMVRRAVRRVGDAGLAAAVQDQVGLRR